MPDHMYLCECVIHPNGHHVKKTARLTHKLEIKKFKDSQGSLSEDIGLVQSNISLESRNEPQPEHSSNLHLSGMLAALTLSPNESGNVEYSNKPNQIPFETLRTSINTLLERRFQKPDSLRHSPSPVPASSHLSSGMGSHERKQTLLLDSIEREACEIINAVDIDQSMDETELQDILNKTAARIKGIGLSLADSLKNPSTETVAERMEKILQTLRMADSRISQLGALLPHHATATPIHIDSSHVFTNPVGRLDTIAQVTLLLGTVAHYVMGLSGKSCDFIISVVTMLVQMAMTFNFPNDSDQSYTPGQASVLHQMPTSLYTALSQFNMDSSTTIYAACPSCNYTHKAEYNRVTTEAIYPDQCANMMLTQNGRERCGTNLLESRQGSQRPLKPFICASLPDYLSRVLADPEAERLCKQACRSTMEYAKTPQSESRTIFESTFMQSFEGPDPSHLFVDSNDKVRLVLGMHVDFFNPNTGRRAAHDSVGIITLVIMNLPEDLRYKPEFIFPIAIIPGPREPPLEELNHYIRPIIEEIRDGWVPGYHLSNTADSPIHGEIVEVALVLSINDLPAARKVSGTAGVSANIFCTICNCRGRETLYRTDFDAWTPRDCNMMRKHAEAWRDAETLAERERIEKEHGVRWSELWRLPYWDPTKMLVVDSMHCVLEGLVHYHCRYVLRLDLEEAKNTKPAPAFEYPWTTYDNNKDPQFQGFEIKAQKQITAIHSLLERPLGVKPDPLDDVQLRNRLQTRNKGPLMFVAKDLDLLHLKVRNSKGDYVSPSTKEHLVELLVQWRLKLPHVSPDAVPKTCDLNTLRYIQHVIQTTQTPSWINSVPLNYGEASAGIIKAGEWKVLSTIYIPIALTTLWGDESFLDQPRFLQLLDHSMSLFEAVILLMRNTMTNDRASQYRLRLKYWVDNLHELHPHTAAHQKRTNVHVAFHLYEFLSLFGPVMSWWTFPFERLIGVIQKINTNDKVGGPLERTLLESYSQGANLRRWLRRPDCPEVIRQFKSLFDKAFSLYVQADSVSQLDDTNRPLHQVEIAHYRHNGVNYSRAKTHVGNSLILYYPAVSSTSPIAGSIQKITRSVSGVQLHVQRQAPLGPNQYDPFTRYPSFPAKTYSAQLQNAALDIIDVVSVISHVARYEFKDRAVIVDLSKF